MFAVLLLWGCATGTGGSSNNTNGNGNGGVDGAVVDGGGPGLDGSPADASAWDSSMPDASVVDAAPSDAGPGPDGGGACTVPTEACTDGTQSRQGCASSRVIARATSIPVIEGHLYAEGDNDQASCLPSGSGDDHHYRIFMLAGETVNLQLSFPVMAGFNGVLVLYQASTACSGTTCDSEQDCQNAYNQSGDTEYLNHTATQDGWHTIVVDSRLNPTYNSDTYYLQVTLSCTGTCGC